MMLKCIWCLIYVCFLHTLGIRGCFSDLRVVIVIGLFPDSCGSMVIGLLQRSGGIYEEMCLR